MQESENKSQFSIFKVLGVIANKNILFRPDKKKGYA